MPKLLIYMPALNEEANIISVIESLPKSVLGFEKVEYLVVDDGSNDSTAILAKNRGAHVISHGKNLGVGGAFHSAVRFSLENSVDVLVGIDADRQFSPDDIPLLIQPILNNQAEMVIGDRFSQGKPLNMDPVKYIGNSIISRIINNICNQQFSDVSCGYRAYSREALLRFNLLGTFTYTHETILSLIFHGKRVIQKPVTIYYHVGRKSRVASSIVKYALNTSKIILQMVLDYKPALFFGTIGSFFSISGFIGGVILLIRYILSNSFSPYKFLGFLSLAFLFIGMLIYLIALITNIFKRLRISQEELLYISKSLRYKIK